MALIVPINEKRLHVKPNMTLKNRKVTNSRSSLSISSYHRKTDEITVFLIN